MRGNFDAAGGQLYLGKPFFRETDALVQQHGDTLSFFLLLSACNNKLAGIPSTTGLFFTFLKREGGELTPRQTHTHKTHAQREFYDAEKKRGENMCARLFLQTCSKNKFGNTEYSGASFPARPRNPPSLSIQIWAIWVFQPVRSLSLMADARSSLPSWDGFMGTRGGRGQYSYSLLSVACPKTKTGRERREERGERRREERESLKPRPPMLQICLQPSSLSRSWLKRKDQLLKRGFTA